MTKKTNVPHFSLHYRQFQFDIHIDPTMAHQYMTNLKKTEN